MKPHYKYVWDGDYLKLVELEMPEGVFNPFPHGVLGVPDRCYPKNRERTGSVWFKSSLGTAVWVE